MKAHESRQDPYLALLALRTNPLKDGSPSPAQQIFQRTIRTIMPNIKHSLAMKKQPENNDKNKELPKLQPYDKVRIKYQNNWKRKGTVLRKLDQPRSYVVKTDEGQIIKRNRRHLLKTREKTDNKRHRHEYENIFHGTQRPNTDTQINIPNTSTTRSGRSITKPARYR